MAPEVRGASADRPPVLFAYFGRRGALSQVTLDLGRTAATAGPVAPILGVSRQNECHAQIAAIGVPVIAIDTVDGPWTLGPRMLSAPWTMRRVVARAAALGVGWVVTLMPHVWSPLLRVATRAAGLRYAVMVHDGDHHPGDGNALLDAWWAWEARNADLVVTWSAHVARRQEAAGVRPDRIATLYHPTPPGYRPPVPAGPAAADPARPGPMRLLFFGRIRLYKGLHLLLAAYGILRREGIDVTLSVVGDGDLSPYADALDRPGIVVENRWLGHDEVPALLARHDLVVLPYVEASQSGVVAAAHAGGRPVVVTPVGGLVEQVRDGVDGTIAAAATPEALADALRRMATDGDLYGRCVAGARQAGEAWPMDRFLEDLWTILRSR